MDRWATRLQPNVLGHSSKTGRRKPRLSNPLWFSFWGGLNHSETLISPGTENRGRSVIVIPNEEKFNDTRGGNHGNDDSDQAGRQGDGGPVRTGGGRRLKVNSGTEGLDIRSSWSYRHH